MDEGEELPEARAGAQEGPRQGTSGGEAQASLPEHRSQGRKRRHECGKGGVPVKSLDVCREGLTYSLCFKQGASRYSFCFGKIAPAACWVGRGLRSQQQPSPCLSLLCFLGSTCHQSAKNIFTYWPWLAFRKPQGQGCLSSHCGISSIAIAPGKEQVLSRYLLTNPLHKSVSEIKVCHCSPHKFNN